MEQILQRLKYMIKGSVEKNLLTADALLNYITSFRNESWYNDLTIL